MEILSVQYGSHIKFCVAFMEISTGSKVCPWYVSNLFEDNSCELRFRFYN